MKIKIVSISIGMVFCTISLQAQIFIESKATIVAKGDVTIKSSFNNTSPQIDLTAVKLLLAGTNQVLTTTSPLTLQGLRVDGAGTKTIKGEWTIARELSFTLGIISSGSGKLVYTGTTTLNGNPSSYVNGTLFQRGTGARFFPIGVGSTYMPMLLNDVQDGAVEIGVTGFTTGASFAQPLPLDLNSVDSNRYWEVLSSSGSVSAASASLYVPGSSVGGSQQLVVVEADNADGATAINLGGGISGEFVTSLSPITRPILTIGIGEKVDLQIHDLITPFDEGENDRLHIVNVQFTSENKVTLLDRWGVVVKEWKNFRNYDDPVNPNLDGFDFSKLSPGNYICLLEYQLTPDSPTENLSQMITVLRGN